MSKRESITTSELLDGEYQEFYYESFDCPICEKSGISKYDNYCSGCGVKIIKEEKEG